MGVGLSLIGIGIFCEILVALFAFIEEKGEKGELKKFCRIDFSEAMTNFAVIGLMFVFAGLLAVFL